MNIENIKFAISVMEQAKNLDMRAFRTDGKGEKCRTITALHNCGAAACFMGYLTLTKEFRDAVNVPGGKVDYAGIVEASDGCTVKYADRTLAEFLGVSTGLAEALIYGRKPDEFPGQSFYEEEWRFVNRYHVIEKLYLILAGELK